MEIADVVALFRRRPQASFFIDVVRERAYSFAEFEGLARSLADSFDERGLRSGDRVAVLAENSPWFAAVYFACLFRGLVVVPINPLLTGRDIDYIVEASRAALLLYTPRTAHLIPEGVSRRTGLRFLVLPGAGDPPALGHPAWQEPADLAARAVAGPTTDLPPTALWVIPFTSGTTSRPKGVPHTLATLTSAASAFNQAYGFGPDVRLYHVLSMAYMAGLLNTLLCPLLAGGVVASDEAFGAPSAMRFWQAPLRYRLNTLWLVPTILASLLRLDRDSQGQDYCRHHIRTVCAGTAPLPRQLQIDFERRYGVEVFESYGLSETLFVAANTPHWPRKPSAVGRLLQGVEARIVAEGGEVLPVGSDGEIEVRSGFHTAGYLDAATGQPSPAAPGVWFPTGDVGHFDAEGDLFITGRKKDLIIKGGMNISPRAVEDALLEHPSVQDAAVLGVPHPFYGEEVLACLELKPGQDAATVLPDLAHHCRGRLGAASAPARFRVLAALPRGSTGKVLKHVLRDEVAAQVQPGAA
jgi:long-chain acyl-CoA synthetase